MKKIDAILNSVTMYRLVVYALGSLVAIAIIFAELGRFSVKPTNMLISLAVILVSAYITDRGFGRLFNVPTNMESWLITGLIIFLIIPAPHSVANGVAIALAAALSSVSKFLLARNGKHFFNPAALAAAFLSLWGFWPATWWIGSSVFWPFTLLLGLAVVRKIRREALFLTFGVVSVLLQTALFLHTHQPLVTGLKHALVASPLIFLATIMLTEPATMPPRRNLQMGFAALVAVLYVMGWKFGSVIIYPEVALLIGNIFAYMVSPKFRVRLELKEIQRISDRVYNYVFRPDVAFRFLPGQYMEWTLAGVPYDNRGNRRTFTIASSPTEEDVHLGLKYYEPASTYKATLNNLRPGDIVWASQLAGNFTIKGNEKKKMAFIAGGVGITPFRSMIKYLTDTNISCDITLLYLVSDAEEFAYVKEFKEAAAIGVKTIPIVTHASNNAPGIVTAKLSPELVSSAVPDYAERIFYISGPNYLVDAAKEYLHDLGVTNKSIKTDHFSGY
jgi:ferredoxin-NADP reductase/Na+-translocating ferredoxin:NAD+ oxidoreductase RnfD subunit